jgi:ribosomal protein S18 acetylase RimI-like enzyme
MMSASSVNFEVPSYIRQLDISRDLNVVADLIELCFPIHLDQDGQTYIRKMRQAARDMRLLRWASSFSELNKRTASGFVWEEQGRILGNLSLIPIHEGGNRVHMIANVAVHPDARRRGIAHALTQKALEHLRSMGEPRAWLQVRDDNPVAYNLYKKLGFKDQLVRTTWRIRPIDACKQRPVSPAQCHVRRRKSDDWTQQLLWFDELYPYEMRWHLPVNLHHFRPDFFQQMLSFFDGERHRHWAFTQQQSLAGCITWQKAPTFANNLWLAFPTDVADDVLKEALWIVLRQLPRRHSLSIDLPKGQYQSALEALGFRHFRTLVWMMCPLKEQRRSSRSSL